MFMGIDPEYRKAQLFYSTAATQTPGQGLNDTGQLYHIPYGARCLIAILCSGGAGGGGGASGAAGTPRGGGAGGAAAGIVTALIPTLLLPDTLYVTVGSGGLGGAAGQNGSAGRITQISRPIRLRTTSFANNPHIVRTGTPGDTNAGNNTTTASGGVRSPGLSSIGVLINEDSFTNGASGGAPSGTDGGNSGNINQAQSGGGGGGGLGENNIARNGGHSETILFRTDRGTPDSPDGRQGPWIDPLAFDVPIIRGGGSGGASNPNGTGGRGGDGGLGSSGGGGGAGLTGGAGGNGGPGFAIIIPVF